MFGCRVDVFIKGTGVLSFQARGLQRYLTTGNLSKKLIGL